MRRLQSCISFLLASQIQVQIYGAKSCRTSVVLPLSGIVMDSRFLSYGAGKILRSRSVFTPPFGKPEGRVRHGDEKRKIPTGSEATPNRQGV